MTAQGAAMAVVIKFQSIKLTVSSIDELRLTRFYRDKRQLGAPVFLLHDLARDGSSFYTAEGEGLACYLAKQGYDVYVADLRGRGECWPKVSAASKFDSHRVVSEDLPALLKEIIKRRGHEPQIWMGHGFGGLLLSAFFARHGDSLVPVKKMVHFGVRRQLLHQSLKTRCHYDLLWKRVAGFMASLRGFLPARQLRLGGCDESAALYADYLAWSDNAEWLDRQDAFNYAEAARQRRFPPSVYLAAKADAAQGHPDDVRRFMRGLGPHDGRMLVLSRKGGNLRNYNHHSMLVHPDCERDHFPLLLAWLQNAESENTTVPLAVQEI
jgi:predicted alpha/beta hydrolase